jgi:hypothetical protein
MNIIHRARPLQRLWRILALIGISSTPAVASSAAVTEEPISKQNVAEAAPQGRVIRRVDDIRAQLAENNVESSDDAPRKYAQWSNWRN